MIDYASGGKVDISERLLLMFVDLGGCVIACKWEVCGESGRKLVSKVYSTYAWVHV